MKIICSKSDLVNGVSTVSKAVPNKSTMEIAECILIDATNGRIRLAANDKELGIETVIEGNIVEKGKIALEAKLLEEMVRKLPDADVTIETQELITSITCGKAFFVFQGKDAINFSEIQKCERKNSIVISQFALKEIIRQTIFAVLDASDKPTLSGECFDVNEDNLKVVAVDGHRLSIRNIKLKDNYGRMRVIIPKKSLTELIKILPGSEDRDVIISFDNSHALFEFDETIVATRLIECEFVKYEQMLSKDYETKFRINKKDFIDSIDRATLLVKEGDKKPVLTQISGEKLQMKINTFIGSMSEDIEIKNKQGKDIIIGFNPKFLLDALKVIDDEEIDIYMVNSNAPCYIKDANETYNYVILPVNVNNVR